MPSITGTRNSWSDKDWVGEARSIRQRGYCRKFTDFLFQVRLGWTTSLQWRKKHVDWKQLSQGFPQKTKTFETRCLTQHALWRFEELLALELTAGVAEREAHWNAADKTIAEFRARNKERSATARQSKRGPDKPRPSKGRGVRRKMCLRKAKLLFKHMSRWAAIRTYCDLYGMTVAQVLAEFFCNEHTMDFYAAARDELERTKELIARGHRYEHLLKRYWPDW